MKRFWVAIAFLTRIPVPLSGIIDAAAIGRAALLFPAVGLVVGALQAATLGISRGLPATLAAVLAIAIGALVTGAMHLDGLADTADGFGGGRDREHVLTIMRDHAIGSFGATALVLDIAFKAAALTTLAAAPGGWRWVALAPALARWTPVALGRALPYARPGGGMGATVTAGAGRFELIGATLLALALALSLGGWGGLAAFGALTIATAVHGTACWARIRGVTGDTFGAAIELGEAVVLLVGIALLR